jgi:hypothetical protein
MCVGKGNAGNGASGFAKRMVNDSTVRLRTSEPATDSSAVIIVGIAERLVHKFFFEWDEDGISEDEEEGWWNQKVPGSNREK